MKKQFKEYVITDNKDELQIDRIVTLLRQTYWAKNWSENVIIEAMNNSICFGVFHDDVQIAYGRCVTDYATMYWLCDIVVDERFRNRGIASELIQQIILHKQLKGLMGILSSNHSKELYKRFGFRLSTNGFMIRRGSKPD